MNSSNKVFSVSQLSREIKRLVEDGIPLLWVEGEISNYKPHGSGHKYFTIKDSEAQISCVMWRTREKPDFDLIDGLNVRIYGKPTVWIGGGRYQFDIQSIIQVGVGYLKAQFEELKKKLDREGLFDFSRKKQLPGFPKSIGIITSETGAAIKDIVWGFRRLYPPAQLFLLPVKVQGKGAAEEIAEAIEFFNQHNLVDVLLIGRGGGSLEDLWAFNEEIVVRAVANSALPVVSAVGHEVDVSLSDLAADVRSPTPTASASLIVPKLSDLLKFLNDYKRSYLSSIENSIILWQERIQSIERGYGFKRVYAIVNEERQRLDSISDKLESSLVRKYDSCCEKLQSIHHRISDLSPQAVLNRGFCIARRQDKWIVKESSQIKPGEEVKLNFSKGSSAAYILEVWSNG